MRSLSITAALLAAGTIASVSQGGVQVFTTYGTWADASPGTDVKLDFVGLQGQLLGEQFAPLGVHFLPNGGVTQFPQVPDGVGFTTVLGAEGGIPLVFDAAQTSFGGDFVSPTKVLFYMNESLVHQTDLFFSPPAGAFRGFVLDTPFNNVVLQGFTAFSAVAGDNLYIGTPIPGPPAALALAILGLRRGARRRDSAHHH